MIKRILVIDDHVAVRRGLLHILEASGTPFAAAEAGTEEEALRLLQASPWDVAVLDISLPGRSGLDFLTRIKEARPATRVMIYTMHDEAQFGIPALRLGANAYIRKDARGDVLIEAILSLCEGKRYITPAMADALANHTAGNPFGVPHDQLSAREMEVMRLLALGKSVTEIGEVLHLSVKTVSTYRTRILEKLNVTTTADIVRYALRNGLVL